MAAIERQISHKDKYKMTAEKTNSKQRHTVWYVPNVILEYYCRQYANEGHDNHFSNHNSHDGFCGNEYIR
jgi:hypothetical protein